jgi:Leucine-rich repeat (LRR) protein
LRSLYLDGNNLTSIKNYYFKSLRNLNLLILSNNKLKTIEKDSFADLTRLEYLYLYGNKITRIDKCIFNRLVALKRLELQRNKLTSLDSELFKQNSNLQNLNLYNNSLSRVDYDLFDGLLNLEYLYLNKNQLETISQKTFEHQSNLKELILDDKESMHFNSIQSFGNNSRIDSLELNSLCLKRIDLKTLSRLPLLKYIYLKKNRIVKLSGSLNNLDELRELHFSYNFREIEMNTFVNLHNLRRVMLDNNQIENVLSNAFINLSYIWKLDIYLLIG